MTRSRRGEHSHPPPAPEHPRAREPWFRKLPESWRRDIADSRDAEAARFAELERQALRTRWVETAQMGALFLATDVVCLRPTVSSTLGSLAVGLCAGWIASRFALARISTCALGLGAMFAAQWTLRGGLSALHLFVFFPFACTCWYLGWLREERWFE